jgi:hypothetical protein
MQSRSSRPARPDCYFHCATAGLFKPDARGSATVVNPPLPEDVEAKNFAVTLEPESGSHESPRGTPVGVGE